MCVLVKEGIRNGDAFFEERENCEKGIFRKEFYVYSELR